MTTLPWGRPLTEDDLALMPDDGHRYELLDGTLIVTPAPGTSHQVCVGSLYVLLHAACPAGLLVLPAPFDVKPFVGTVLQPDVLVARRADFTAKDIRKPLLLAVEVRSPSTASIDLGAKMLAYARAGIPSYWVVDPDAPSIRAFALQEGAYVEVAAAAGDETVMLDAPYRVAVTPARLLDALR
ncbi:MAG TPA: Uma2 family endonuclease [Mycobacteriales bacterium]|nr:Uma2 family endonuclease [Mycobacteriales bacterium]